MITLDLPGGPLEFPRGEVERLRATAARLAGHSSAARDLALLLNRALDGTKLVALRRAEVQTLTRVAREAGLDQLADDLDRRSSSA